jgi:hypothetical protein
MSEFGDISRMDLSRLERKGYQPEDDEDIEDTESGTEEDGVTADAVTVDADTEETVSLDGQAEGAGNNELAVVESSADEDQEPEVEVVDNRERMAAPTGKHYYIDAEITTKEMTAFLFAHNYRSPLMLLATLVGLVWPIYTVIMAKGSLLFACVCAGVFLFLMPFSIWRRGTTSVKNNPIYENTFHYMLDETGVHLELAEHAVDVEWSKVTRTMFLKSSAVIYTGKINAYLIPTVAMGDKKDEIIAFIKSHTR